MPFVQHGEGREATNVADTETAGGGAELEEGEKMENQVLIPAAEAAEMLGVHTNTLRMMCAKQIVPACKFGRQWRIRRVAFIAWISS